jgi:protein-S-isoprenylcysteine O-methyltransferase Ste14
MPSEQLFRVLFWILILGVLMMRIVFTLRVRLAGERVMPDRAAVKREGVPAFLIRVFGGFLVVGLLAAYALQPAWLAVLSIPIPDVIRWTGFVLGLFGLGVWIWAQVALGKEWSPQLQLREGHRLITTGLYARMRHPLYSGMILWSGGLALLAASWIFIVFTALFGAAFLMRIPREEQMMIGEFGEEYREYMQRTGSVFPKL